jgi:hypothetical protein
MAAISDRRMSLHDAVGKIIPRLARIACKKETPLADPYKVRRAAALAVWMQSPTLQLLVHRQTHRQLAAAWEVWTQSLKANNLPIGKVTANWVVVFLPTALPPVPTRAYPKKLGTCRPKCEFWARFS